MEEGRSREGRELREPRARARCASPPLGPGCTRRQRRALGSRKSRTLWTRTLRTLTGLALALGLAAPTAARAEQGALVVEVSAGTTGLRSESSHDGLWGWGTTAALSAEARYALRHHLELGVAAGAHPGAWVRLEGPFDGYEERLWRARTAWGAGVARLYVAGLRWRLFATASLGLAWTSSDGDAAGVPDGGGLAWIPFDVPPLDRLVPRATAGVGLEHAWDNLAAGVRLSGGLAFPEAPQVGLRFHLAWAFYL